MHLHALLPQSNRQVEAVVVSPDHTQAAFISQDMGGEKRLWTISLTAPHSQPQPGGCDIVPSSPQ